MHDAKEILSFYSALKKSELKNSVKQLKEQLGSKVVIGVHHYQDPDIVEFADFVGDSYQLALQCSRTKADFIILCGVYFMAEVAYLVAGGKQVLIPDPEAGCPMASMAKRDAVEKAYETIVKAAKKEVVPVVYMNSYADIKDFCGLHGGSVCTSSNAEKILNYYLRQDKAIFFLPDFHLGYNTAMQMGYNDSSCLRVKQNGLLETLNNSDTKNSMNYQSNKKDKLHENNESFIDIKDHEASKETQIKDIENVKFYLWDGFCHVHQEFTEKNIKDIKEKNPQCTIIVHPECNSEILALADVVGSTQQILEFVRNAPSKSIIAVGTEGTFVDRLASEYPDKIILPLKLSFCPNMQKITLPKLARSLDSIQKGKGKKYYFFNVDVNEKYMKNARKAVEMMLKIVENSK